MTGTIRDFVYKEIGNNGPFFRHSNLSEKRFSRPFTLTQICLNSFAKMKTGEFARARLQDIEEFFEQHHDLDKKDDNLTRIREVLRIMDKEFGQDAINISSRAVAVSGYLFVEDLYQSSRTKLIPKFSKFYLKLLEEIKRNTAQLSNYERPSNSYLMEDFQKYILQASVEAYSIKRRHDFLEKTFAHYVNSKTRGRIMGVRDSA